MVDNLPEDLKDFARFAYYTGMRKGEIASLRWEDWTVTLSGYGQRTRRTERARFVPIEGELEKVIERRMAARQVTTRGGVMLAALVFHRAGGGRRGFSQGMGDRVLVAGPGKLVCPECGQPVDADRNARSALRLGCVRTLSTQAGYSMTFGEGRSAIWCALAYRKPLP